MSLLAGTVQPAVLTLLSSTSRPALSPLWSVHEGSGEASFVEVLRDDEYPGSSSNSADAGSNSPNSNPNPTANAHASSSKPPTSSRASRSKHHVPRHPQPGSLADPVIHIQSARPDTFIATVPNLGVTLPYLGFQIKALGKHRGMSVEVEMVDPSGKRGVVRMSSWKTRPTLHAARTPPLAHLPLALPSESHKLTDWAELNLHLPSLMGLFRSLKPEEGTSDAEDEEDSDGDDGGQGRYSSWRGREGYRRRGGHPPRPKPRAVNKNKRVKYDLPSTYASTSSVRIYASCRIRRVWFSAEGDKSLDTAGVRDEWALYTGSREGSP